jgi:hypothetical protein
MLAAIVPDRRRTPDVIDADITCAVMRESKR